MAVKRAIKASTADVTFTLPADVQAGSVALCGEFSEWPRENVNLERDGDGSWRATFALEPGHSYRYRYLPDGRRWENAWQADGYVPSPLRQRRSGHRRRMTGAHRTQRCHGHYR